MKVNNYPLKTPSAGDKLFGSDSNGDQKQFDIESVMGGGFQYYIGQYLPFQGGIVFYRYLNETGENYLIVDTANLSNSQSWSNVTSTEIGITAQSTYDGISNSNAIIGQAGQLSSAAKLCIDSTSNSQTDWYLPSVDELLKLRINRLEVNQTLADLSLSQITLASYVSSTEFSATQNFNVDFQLFQVSLVNKSTGYRVRAIRKFSI